VQVSDLCADVSATRRPWFATRTELWGVLVDMHATESSAPAPTARLPRPVIVGHRGAPAYRPEHTTGSYELAIAQGADLIEPDVVVSKDGVLVVRHENELSQSTDIAARPEFADRRTTKQVGEEICTGWFAEDLTLAELRTLRAVERLPQLRPLNASYDGRWGVLTFAEVVEVARRASTAARTVRVLAELKEPSWSASIGLPMAELVAAELRRLDAATADGTVVVQSFDRPALRALRADLGDRGPEVFQLVDDTVADDATVTPAGLREVSTYAQGIAPSRDRILLRDEHQALTGISDLVGQAHRAGLRVVPWTLRAENAFLPRHLRRGTDVRAIGDLEGEARMLFALGVDGLITDSPDLAGRARDDMAALDAAPAQDTAAA
jgi:glycerophosphoryl diester phosphodiesterase